MVFRMSSLCRRVRTSSNVFKLNQTCFVGWSLVMRHWFLSKTLKPSARAINGSLQRCSQMSNVVMIRFVDVSGIVHQEFLLQVCKEIPGYMLCPVSEKKRELRLQHGNTSANNALGIWKFLFEWTIGATFQFTWYSS